MPAPVTSNVDLLIEEGEGKYYDQQNRHGNDATWNTTFKKGKKNRTVSQ